MPAPLTANASARLHSSSFGKTNPLASPTWACVLHTIVVCSYLLRVTIDGSELARPMCSTPTHRHSDYADPARRRLPDHALRRAPDLPGTTGLRVGVQMEIEVSALRLLHRRSAAPRMTLHPTGAACPDSRRRLCVSESAGEGRAYRHHPRTHGIPYYPTEELWTLGLRELGSNFRSPLAARRAYAHPSDTVEAREQSSESDRTTCPKYVRYSERQQQKKIRQRRARACHNASARSIAKFY